MYIPPTQEPSGKHTTASVRRSSARKLPRNTCSNRRATGSSSSTVRGQIVGEPDDPDDTASMSPAANRPPRHLLGSGNRRR